MIIQSQYFRSVRELPANYADPIPPVQGCPVRIRNIRPKSGAWTQELEIKVENHLLKQRNIIARFSQIPMAGGDSNLPRNLRSADLYLATDMDPLKPAYRAFERLVESGDLEYINENELVV